MKRPFNVLPLVRVLIVLLSFQTIYFASSSPIQSEETRVERLVKLCRLWGQVKYFHPGLAYRTDIDWDKALVEAIPKINAAKTTEEYRVAVQSMLDVLGDRSTRLVQQDDAGSSVTHLHKNLEYRMTEDKILLIHAGSYFDLYSASSQKTLADIAREIQNARAIVFDLRATTSGGAYGNGALTGSFGPIERLISTQTILTPGQRSRLYYGYESAGALFSGQYRSGMFTQNGKRIAPLRNARDLPSVYLLNEYSGVLPSIVPLQLAGKSQVVFEGSSAQGLNGITLDLEIGDGLGARVRVSESLYEDGTTGEVQPDAVVTNAEASSDKGLETALTLARNFKPSTAVRKKLPSSAISIPEKSYPEMYYPTPEYRLLSAFRIWNTINYFFPYKKLMDRDWDEVLREFIPKFEHAANELEYSLTVAEMVTHLGDSHVYLRGRALDEYFGLSYPPVRARWIENSPVITSITEESAKRAGVEIGDVILKVDGEDAIARVHRYAKYISAATAQSRMYKAAFTFMNGKEGTVVTLTVQGPDKREREVKLTRKYEDYRTLYNQERSGDVFKLLPGNIGYADLDRLSANRFDEMLEQFKNTRAIIFDMRGYPAGLAYWFLTPRFNEKQNVRAALLETPLVGQNTSTNSSEAFYQMVQPTPPGKWIYKGTTVMLIDERVVSQAEHTGLFFRAANGTKFVGSPTAGTNGEISTFTVPGAITIGFTGQSVKFPDGQQLQRVGLVPDVLVTPTIEGIRKGRDEVLERAMDYLDRQTKR